MIWLKIFAKDSSANVAKDRLTLVLAHERSIKVPYMDDMKREILEVVKKYTNANADKITIKADSNQHINTLEVEIKLEQ